MAQVQGRSLLGIAAAGHAARLAGAAVPLNPMLQAA
jgi:hypothetical protein